MRGPSFVLPMLVILTTTTSVGAVAQSRDRQTVTGRIVNRLGCPLIAEFKLRPGTAPFVDGALQVTHSDDEGRFEFRDVEPGRYWIHYVLGDGGWGGDGVIVGAGEAHKEFKWPVPYLTDVQDLEFTVTDRDGNPLAGANVAWRRFSGAVGGPACGLDVRTDVEGRAKVAQASSGFYRVTVDADGRVPQTRDIRFGSGYEKTATFRLLTPPEAERAARTLYQVCSPSHEPTLDSLQQVVSRSDAVVVGRLTSAMLDPVYRDDTYPTVLTRYTVDIIDVLKAHPQLTPSLSLPHLSGELESGKEILIGCQGPAMPTGETYVLFLTWNEQRRELALLSGGAFTAKVTTGNVAPVRLTYTPSSAIRAFMGRPAQAFVSAIKAAALQR